MAMMLEFDWEMMMMMCSIIIGGKQEPTRKDNKCLMRNTHKRKATALLCSVGTGSYKPNSDHHASQREEKG